MGTLEGAARLPYEAPALNVVGTVHDLTKASAAGRVTDKAFPAGSPIINLSFS
jgi:hypothetical protein